MNKGIKIMYDDAPYYGVSLHIWDTDNGETREEFIKDLKDAIKDSEWLQKNMNIGDVWDFLDTLSNNLNGDDLYKNVIDNFYYVEELHEKAREMNLSKEFNKTVFNNYNYNGDEETISIFEKVTQYLENTEEFQEWFLDKIEYYNNDLYLVLTNPEEGKKKLIEYKKEELERCKRDYIRDEKSYEEDLKKLKEKIQELQEELDELEDNNVKD